MRTIAFLGIAAALAMAPAMAESAPGGASVSAGDDWSSVPTLPLRPPAEIAPKGNWSSDGGWHGKRAHPHARWESRRGEHRSFEHFRPQRGHIMPPLFVSPAYFVWNWRSYGLPEPGHGRRWVRYYGDAVLIDEYGRVHDTAYDVDWGEPGRDDRYAEDEMPPGWGWGGYYRYPPAYYYVPVGSTTVIVHGAPVETTTTVIEEEVIRPRSKTWKPRRKCFCK